MTLHIAASHAALTGVCNFAKEAHTDLLKQAEEALASLPEDTENRWKVELLVMNLRIHRNVFAKLATENGYENAK